METQVEKIDSVRRVLAGLLTRLSENETKARSREWPFAGLSGETRAYVVNQSAIARGLISTIAAQLGFQGPDMIEKPLEGSTVSHFIGSTMMLAQASGVSADEAQAAAFASVEQLKKLVVDIVRHLEAVVEGDETIDGRAITHGALYYK